MFFRVSEKPLAFGVGSSQRARERLDAAIVVDPQLDTF